MHLHDTFSLYAAVLSQPIFLLIFSLLPFPLSFHFLPFVYLCPVCAGYFYSLLSKFLGESKDVVHVHKYNPSEAVRAQAELVAQIDSIMQKKDLGWPSPRLGFGDREDAVLVRNRVHKFHQLEGTARPPGSKLGMPAANAAAIEAGTQKQGGFFEGVRWSC